MVTDALAPGLEFVAASSGGRFDTVTRSVTWTPGVVEQGGSGAFSLRVRVGVVPDGTTITNAATILSQQTGPLNSDTVAVTVTSEAAISIDIDSSPAAVVPGAVVTFSSTVVNTSSNPAENLIITGRLPAAMSYLSSSNGGSFSAGQVT